MEADPVAARIKALRTERKISQETLAEETGIERWKLASMESGRRRVSSHEVALFAEALDVEPAELLRAGTPVRLYRLSDMDSLAVREAMAEFDHFVSTSLRLERLERFSGGA